MKTKPYLLIIILCLVLFFIIGFRAGQRTEKTNKVVDYVLSITPYPTYTPFPTIPLPTKEASVSPTLKINRK